MPPDTVKPGVFVCPDTGHRTGSINSISSWTDYIYVGGLHDEFVLGVPLVISPPENHGEKYGYVIWTDGVVARLPAEQIRKLIADPFCMDTFNGQDDVEAERRRMVVQIPIQIPKRLKKQYEDPELARLNELGAVLELLTWGRFPLSLQEIPLEMPPEMLRPEIFVSPGTGHKASALNAVAAWSDYIYVGGLDNEAHSGVPLVISPPENYGGKCGYALWMDGGATRLSAEKTRELIADPFCMARFEVRADQKEQMKLQIPERLKRYYAVKQDGNAKSK
jgi:hypothetical protein